MIAAVGDIILGSPFPDDTRMPPNDGADLLKPVTSVLSAADIAFGNMEGPIVDEGISEKCGVPKPGQPMGGMRGVAQMGFVVVDPKGVIRIQRADILFGQHAGQILEIIKIFRRAGGG